MSNNLRDQTGVTICDDPRDLRAVFLTQIGSHSLRDHRGINLCSVYILRLLFVGNE